MKWKDQTKVAVPRSLISTGDAAKKAGVSPHIIRSAIKSGQLPCVEVASRYYVKTEDVLKLFKVGNSDAA